MTVGRLPSELRPVHAGHDDIRQQKPHLGGCCQQGERMGAVMRLDRPVSELAQRIDGETPHFGLVLDDDDRLVAARRPDGTGERRADFLGGGGVIAWEEDANA
eukprot:gene29125-32657_t